MDKRVNLQDNIFVLNSRLKILWDTMILDTDPALFMEKIVEDTKFLDHALETLLQHLWAQDRLFDRGEILDYLSDLEWDISRFLAEFSGNSGGISAAPYPVLRERLQLLRDRSEGRLRTINEDRKTADAPAMENAVSSDELNELLKDF
jgi:hypothetical protein